MFVLAGVFFTDPFGSALATVVGYITDYLGWLYMLMTAFFLVFAVWLALSRYGKIRLGQPDDKPEFGRFAWFAMLFQAGIGIGLVFWAVSEPVTHYADPPLGLAKPETADAASLALQTVFFHWGLHPWAIYAVVGLAVAYFSFFDLRFGRRYNNENCFALCSARCTHTNSRQAISPATIDRLLMEGELRGVSG